MDASKDPMYTTFEYLASQTVFSTREILPEQMTKLLNLYVNAATPYLRDITLATIISQTPYSMQSVPESIKKTRALRVYALGEAPWIDPEIVEYWFVDRNGMWYWVKYDVVSGAQDWATVSCSHLVERKLADEGTGTVNISTLGDVTDAFMKKFDDAASAAHDREVKLRKAATEQAKFYVAIHKVQPFI